MALGASKRAFVRHINTAGRWLMLPLLAAASVAACSDDGTTGIVGTAGTGGTVSTAAGTAGAASNVSGSATAGSAVTAGSGGTVSTAGTATGGGGSSAGAGGASGSAGSATAGNSGTGGTDSAGTSGTAGTGGTTPVCSVPNAGGVDFASLLVGPKSIEGEASTMTGAAALAGEGSGWSGTGFADMKGAEGAMTWLIDAPVAGEYTLNWTYTQNDTRDMRLTVNCTVVADSVAFTNTGSWNTAWTTGGAQKVKLARGTNQIVLETNGDSGPNFDVMIISPPICALAGDASTTCEGERALLSGAAFVETAGTGWTDLGFADMAGQEGAVNWVVDAPYAGPYTLTFVYTQDDTRDMSLSVNGVVAAASLPFNDTNSWNTAWASDVTYDVTLKKGVNSLQLSSNGASGPNFDSVKVQGLGAGGDGAGGAGGGGP